MIALLLALALQTAPSQTLPPDEEARAFALMQEIRCVVCAGQSIADSDAPLAQDMRAYVRGRVAAGERDADVREALAARYGDEVLLRPRMGGRTMVLWIAPFVLLLLGAALLVMAGRRRKP